ncbi:MAG: IclR family transcriptional regulator [Clostridia bacterium]|nr:IclR family transcriptional regulator [Clostridia bacterium]
MNGTNQNLSIMKALDIIEYLAEKNNEPQRLRDIAEALGMNISTVSRFLSSLVLRGYVRQDADSSRYFLSLRFCGIADRINANLQVYTLALPVMKEISSTLKESVCLGIEQNAMVEYIGVVSAADQMMRTMQRIGNRAPMYCTGIGKLLLCAHTREEVRHILQQRGMDAFTPHTITDENALLEELDRVREQGYAYDNEECEIGARCVAMPVYNQYHQIIAGVSVTGPIFRLTDQKIREFLPYFSAQVQRISSLLI